MPLARCRNHRVAWGHERRRPAQARTVKAAQGPTQCAVSRRAGLRPRAAPVPPLPGADRGPGSGLRRRRTAGPDRSAPGSAPSSPACPAAALRPARPAPARKPPVAALRHRPCRRGVFQTVAGRGPLRMAGFDQREDGDSNHVRRQARSPFASEVCRASSSEAHCPARHRSTRRSASSSSSAHRATGRRVPPTAVLVQSACRSRGPPDPAHAGRPPAGHREPPDPGRAPARRRTGGRGRLRCGVSAARAAFSLPSRGSAEGPARCPPGAAGGQRPPGSSRSRSSRPRGGRARATAPRPRPVPRRRRRCRPGP